MNIGVIGGGQLGRMLALAGTPLGMSFAFLDPAPDACAAALGEHLLADYGDQEHLRQLANDVDLVTFEFESVPAETVAFLSQFVPVYPSAEALRIARDRWFEKSMFKDLGIPTPAFADIQSQADLDDSGILRLSIASTDHPLQALAEDYAGRVLKQLDYVGVLAFEFFEVDGGLKANEIAPRVHNSGHWTTEGAECSQFENHLRAVAGLPLGSTAKVGESAMLNFIGEVPGVSDVIAIEDCHLHHYGKAFKAGRKVGHATVRSKDRTTLDRQVKQVEALIKN
jgi:phosphoribosylaminoimidazole carboxylase (NCAIR synthetase)